MGVSWPSGSLGGHDSLAARETPDKNLFYLIGTVSQLLGLINLGELSKLHEYLNTICLSLLVFTSNAYNTSIDVFKTNCS